MSTLAGNFFKELLAKKIIDFANDSFKIILMQKGFAYSRSAHDTYADVVAEEHVSGTGYTAAGLALAGVTITRDDINNIATVAWDNASWLATGGNLEADGAIIYDDSIASPGVDPIIGYVDFGGTYLCYDGGTLAVANITVAIT